VDSSCHNVGSMWTLSTSGVAMRYAGGRKLTAAPRVPKGLMQLATSCGGRLWALTRAGRVVTFRGRALGWRRTPRGPRFVRVQAGGRRVMALTRRGKLYRLTKRGGGRWVKVSPFQTLRDLAITCGDQVLGVDRNFRPVYRTRSGHWFPLKSKKLSKAARRRTVRALLKRARRAGHRGARLRVMARRFALAISRSASRRAIPRVRSLAVSVKKHGVYGITFGGKVVVYRRGVWSTYRKIRLDTVGVTRTGEACGTYGRNFYLHFAGARAPSVKKYRRVLKGRKNRLLTPGGVDKSSLMKSPFSLGKFRKHVDALNPYASPLPTSRVPLSKAYVKDNLPVSAVDFRAVANAPPGRFATYQWGVDPANGPLQDPLPDPKAELALGRRGDPTNSAGAGRPKNLSDRLSDAQIKSLSLGFRASASPGNF
jgi:hypothetical protein